MAAGSSYRAAFSFILVNAIPTKAQCYTAQLIVTRRCRRKSGIAGWSRHRVMLRALRDCLGILDRQVTQQEPTSGTKPVTSMPDGPISTYELKVTRGVAN